MKTDPPRPHVQSNLPKEYNWCFSQGWEFTHSLKFLRTNEQMWAIRWGRTGQMSDSERIAEVVHDKWANVSDSLRLLRTNERMSEWHSFFEQITHFLFCSQKMSNLLNKIRKNVFLGKFVTVFFISFLKKQKFHSFLLSKIRNPKFDEQIPNPGFPSKNNYENTIKIYFKFFIYPLKPLKTSP